MANTRIQNASRTGNCRTTILHAIDPKTPTRSKTVAARSTYGGVSHPMRRTRGVPSDNVTKRLLDKADFWLAVNEYCLESHPEPWWKNLISKLETAVMLNSSPQIPCGQRHSLFTNARHQSRATEFQVHAGLTEYKENWLSAYRRSSRLTTDTLSFSCNSSGIGSSSHTSKY